MTFVDCLEQYLDNHTAVSLAKQVGCAPSSITDYRDGVEPKPERKQKIAGIIGYTGEEEEEFEAEIEYVEPKEAAARMGISEYKLKFILQSGKVPFGFAYLGSGDKFNYLIFRTDFEDFMEKHKKLR